MNEMPGRSTVIAMVFAALAARLFWGVGIDQTGALNAGWLCAAASLLLALPAAFALSRAARLGNDGAWQNLASRAPRALSLAFECLFAALLVLDAASNARMMANTANAMSQNGKAIYQLMIPMTLLGIFAAAQGADAAARISRLWLLIMPLLLGTVIAVQFKRFNWRWLTPLLGTGTARIADGTAYCGGCSAMLLMMWAVAVPDRKRGGAFKALLLGTLLSAGLLILMQMLSPADVVNPPTHAARIDLLLSNGRVALSLQLLLALIWYGALLQLYAAEITVACCYWHLAFPKLKRGYICAFTVAAITALALSRISYIGTTGLITRYLYLLVTVPMAVMMIIAAFRRQSA